MKIGIVINSRLSSSRIPQKALAKINGLPIIQHLLSRLEKTGLPIFIAVPKQDYLQYLFLNESNKVTIHSSLHDEDPLARMSEVVSQYGLDYVVRVTHDKIFVDTKLLTETIEAYLNNDFDKPDCIFLNGSIPGTGFDIFSAKALRDAACKFSNVEYIGYAIKEVTKNIKQVEVNKPLSGGIRLLIDYPKDLTLMHTIFSQLGNECTLEQVMSYLYFNLEIKQINQLPKVTVYTCAYNAEKWIKTAIDSVLNQNSVNFEYILVDDFSTDRTVEIMARASSIYSNVRFIRNDKNMGLASSCNVALKEAKGDYIIRLDADDYFSDSNSLAKLYRFAEKNKLEITYPDYYSVGENYPTGRHKGIESHHAGGALFHRGALNYVKFTEGLRGHDSLDVWKRAKEILTIGYFEEPTFCYTQREGSLSKTNIEYREKVKTQILRGEDVSQPVY